MAHAQEVRQEPRALLRAIGNVELVEIRDGDICCGSEGTYNIEQPDIAAELGQIKVKAILATDCDRVAAGNIGCLTQIESHLRRQRRQVPVIHTMQVLDEAYQRSASRARRQHLDS